MGGRKSFEAEDPRLNPEEQCRRVKPLTIACGTQPRSTQDGHFALRHTPVTEHLLPWGFGVHVAREWIETAVTNRIRESRLEHDLVRRVSVSAVDVLRHQGIWRENLARALLCVVPLFSMVFGLAGCDRRPVTERNTSEPGGTAPLHGAPCFIHSLVHLLDASEAMLFGAASASRWLPAASAAPLTQEGMKYGLYTLTGRLGESRGEKARPPSKSCSNPSVNIVDVPQLDADVIAVSANWNALPRTPSVHSTQRRAYRNLVAQWLRAQGIADPLVEITQIVRIHGELSIG